MTTYELFQCKTTSLSFDTITACKATTLPNITSKIRSYFYLKVSTLS